MFKFSIPISADAKDVFAKAKNAIVKHGGTVKGNEESGEFAGQGIEGEYSISNKEINITIHKKPFIVPEAIIKSEVAKFF